MSFFVITPTARRVVSASAAVSILTLLTACGTPGLDSPFAGFNPDPFGLADKLRPAADPVPVAVPATVRPVRRPIRPVASKPHRKPPQIGTQKVTPPASVAPSAAPLSPSRWRSHWGRDSAPQDDATPQPLVSQPVTPAPEYNRSGPAVPPIVPAPEPAPEAAAPAPTPAPDEKAGIADRFRKSIMKRRETDPAADSVWPSKRSDPLPHASDDKE
jgi:hypothetical protein